MNSCATSLAKRLRPQLFRCTAAVVLMLALAIPALAGDPAPSASAPDAPEIAMLQARGLVGGKLTEDRGRAVIPTPPPGAEVRVYQAGLADGALNASMTEWEEPLGDDTLSVIVASRGGASQVSYWVLPKNSLGCLIYSYRIFDTSGHVVRSEFWRRTDLIKTADGKDFPKELYPFGPNGGMPPTEVMRAIGTPANGAAATIYSQFTPDGYVILDLWVDGTEEITTAAGKFSAVRLIMRPNVRSFLPSWPGFVLKMLQPFLPRETFYFEAKPPYRFLEFEGVPGASGPKVKTEIVRSYVQGQPGNAISSAR